MKSNVQRSLRKKVSICFLVFSAVVLVGMIAIVGTMYTNYARAQLEEQVLYEDRLVSQQISLVQEHVNSCANTIIINLNEYLDHGEVPSSTFNISTYNTTVASVLENATALYPVVTSVTVVYESQAYYSKVNNGMPSIGTISDELFVELNAGDYSTKGTWVRDLGFQSPSSSTSLYYVKILRSIYSNRTIGYVLVMIDEATLYELYENNSITSAATEMYIADSDGYLLSSSERALVGDDVADFLLFENENFLDKISNTRTYDIYTTVLQNGWSIISVVNFHDAILGFDELITQIVVLSIILLLVFTLIILWVVGKIMRPMHHIAQFFLDFNIAYPKRLPQVQSKDEIGLLVSNFNTMVDTNVELYEKVEQDQLNQRQLELALLQNQIKPHFLYNTLDTIYCLSSMNETDASAKVTKLLAEYYRNVLNKGSEWICIKNEIVALEKYLEIQSIRYNEILRFEIVCDPLVDHVLIPKLTLQPLVENAIYHGIKPKKSMGTIKVHAYQERDHVCIEVIDDGIGMSEEQFYQEIQKRDTDQINDSFGTRNVHERLTLFYDEDSGLRFKPSAVGTTVVVYIQLKDYANGEQ